MELYCITATFEDGSRQSRYSPSQFAASQRHAEFENTTGVVRVTTEPFSVPSKSYPAMVEFLNTMEERARHAPEPSMGWFAKDNPPSDSALESQVGGDHYKKLGKYQPWLVLKEWLTPEEFRGYMKGQAIAYLARERDKGGDQDIAKAEHYLRGLLEMQEPTY